MCKVVFLEIIGVLLYAKAFASIKNFDKKIYKPKNRKFLFAADLSTCECQFRFYVCM